MAPNSAAAAADIQEGDVIERVDRKSVHSVSDYQGTITETSNQPVLILIDGKGLTHHVVVQPQS